MTDPNPFKLMGLKEAAELLQTDVPNVKALVEAGVLPCVRVGAGLEPRVARITLEAWLRRLGENGADRVQAPVPRRGSLRRVG